MRKTLLASLVAAAALLSGTTTAGAINTYNAQAAPELDEVGAYVALWDYPDDDKPARFDWVCSGTMIDEDTFLTAGHCTTLTDWPEGTRHFVTLEDDIQTLLDNATGTALEQANAFLLAGYIVEGDPHTEAGYPGNGSDAHDIGVIDFPDARTSPAENPRWSFTPAQLPTAGQLDKASKSLQTAAWTVVGYGTSEAARGPGGHTHPGGGVRMKAAEGFNSLTKTWVKLDMHKSHGVGGACYGDSGGPNFVVLGGVRLLASTTITGDTPCYATNVTYRTDTPTARNFLKDYVTLP